MPRRIWRPRHNAPRVGHLHAVRPERETETVMTPTDVMAKILTATIKFMPPGTHIALVCAPADGSALAITTTLSDDKLAGFLEIAAKSANKLRETE